MGTSLVGCIYLELSPIYYAACPLISIFFAYYQQKQKKERERKQYKFALMSKSPGVMNHCLMLILAGIHPRNAILESVKPLLNNSLLNDTVSQFIQDLNSGIPLEGSILSFSSRVEYKPFCQMLQRLALFEKTGNVMILNQLESDLLDMSEQFNELLLEQINASDLKSIFPSLMNLLILMIMLMAPILIGGVL